MYRKSIQDSTYPLNIMENAVKNSEFFTRLFKLPVINSAVSVASDFYGKAKNSGGIVGKTIGLAESTSLAVASQVIPLAQKFTPLAAPALLPLEKVDKLANFGLEQLETRAPIITKQPQEIMTETRELIGVKVAPAVQRFNTVYTLVLSNPIAQITFDILENMLDTASKVADRILPAKVSDTNGITQNGLSHEASPADKSARLGYLFRKAYYLTSSVTKRLFGIAQHRVESVVSVGDNVVNTARKSLNNILTAPAATTPVVVQQNGESKPSRKQPKKTQ